MSVVTYFPFNATIVAGDDVPMSFVFTEDGVDVDISGWNFFYTAKSAFTDVDASAVIALDPADMDLSANTPGGTVNKLTFLLPHGATEHLAGTYVHDLQVVRAGGLVTTLGRGQLVVEEQATIRTA